MGQVQQLQKKTKFGREIITHVLHELLAGRSDVLSEGSTEHHDLLVVRSRTEDILDISSHLFECGNRGSRMIEVVNNKSLEKR